MVQALLVGIIAGLGILDERSFGAILFGRPIVLSVFVGLVLGDVKQGIIIGAQLELVWMGIAGIGASTPPDYVTGGVIGTALAIISGKGIGIALAIAVPVAVLAQSLGILVRVINLYFSHKADEYAKQANFKGIALMLWIPAVLFFLSTFLPAFLAMLLGAGRIEALVNAIPKVWLDGLTVAGNLLPAVGFALLLDMLYSKKMVVFFFFGFLLTAYMHLDVTAIALLAACIGIIINFFIKDDNGNGGSDNQLKQDDGNTDNLTEGEIDFE
ncbi:PTS mannose/fructose/sorbose/N-acetylgalactosamine transporter subunit IIC [Ligilactobacillus pobuzihii]|uniref:Phosphotransferase system pts, sorbose-specific iic subunit n=1 Tax=Ligilactobacillus pobuzihii TaxID=449659 RepID=A0A0R2LPC7_9LACO|nr:PTS sugar transporter subunit IIC [Ligilactobacillus pobuzihii]KRK09492.1 phosphotransferase system pts, sorbose-specific iic subunit [Ligilactobacillus pobuzihii E100301 = KCTC 13174]KRO01298.1 phosphotransferase system pts, sorbose-specific iic subunit [Ligilactobacillus pobuzihii]GEN48885.1 PTS mannose transporter subunit IICD [Ligilactobacillus pobuzihii]